MDTDEHRLAERPATDQDPLTEVVIAAAFEVSRTLGHGFLESVYRKAMLHELELRGVNVAEEVRYPVSYKRKFIGDFVADLIVDRSLILELKAISALTSAHTGQVLNYLRASRLSRGLLLNFGTPKVEIRRVSL